eukprot:363781-Chlamydomonas_euryale.AAC.23
MHYDNSPASSPLPAVSHTARHTLLGMQQRSGVTGHRHSTPPMPWRRPFLAACTCSPHCFPHCFSHCSSYVPSCYHNIRLLLTLLATLFAIPARLLPHMLACHVRGRERKPASSACCHPGDCANAHTAPTSYGAPCLKS